MTNLEIADTMDRCFAEGYEFHFSTFPSFLNIWASYSEPDTITGEEAIQITRLWTIERDRCTPSAIVGTCFKCLLTSMEHRARESFKYRGQAVFHPHRDVEDLVELCQKEVVEK